MGYLDRPGCRILTLTFRTLAGSPGRPGVDTLDTGKGRPPGEAGQGVACHLDTGYRRRSQAPVKAPAVRAKTSPHLHLWVRSSSPGGSPMHAPARAGVTLSLGRAWHRGQVTRGRRRVPRGRAGGRASPPAVRAEGTTLAPWTRFTTGAWKAGPSTTRSSRRDPRPQ